MLFVQISVLKQLSLNVPKWGICLVYKNIKGLKLIAFGLQVLEMDAHDFVDIQKKLQQAKDNKQHTVAIIAHSTPGKGVSFMENDYRWHGRAPNKQEFESAMQELRIKKQQLSWLKQNY